MPRRERRRAAANSEPALALLSSGGDRHLSALLCAEFGGCAGVFWRGGNSDLSLPDGCRASSVSATLGLCQTELYFANKP